MDDDVINDGSFWGTPDKNTSSFTRVGDIVETKSTKAQQAIHQAALDGQRDAQALKDKIFGEDGTSTETNDGPGPKDPLKTDPPKKVKHSKWYEIANKINTVAGTASWGLSFSKITNIAKIGKIGGPITYFIGVVFDYSAYNTGKINGHKFWTNTVIGGVGLGVAPISIGYSILDNFYPGGAAQAKLDYARWYYNLIDHSNDYHGMPDNPGIEDIPGWNR